MSTPSAPGSTDNAANNIPAKIPTAREIAHEWFIRTGHCHGCGNPGNYCTCSPGRPCRCGELHQVGSAHALDALDDFLEQPVSVDQEAMW